MINIALVIWIFVIICITAMSFIGRIRTIDNPTKRDDEYDDFWDMR